MATTRGEAPAGRRRSQLYLLRLWREDAGGSWRLALRGVGDEEPIGLADLDELVLFLLRKMACDEKETGAR